jgi:hypothetical protein
MASKTPGGRGFQLRCLQEHPEGVLLGFSPPNLEPGLRAKKRVSQFGLPHPVGAQPSREKSISFLSPARATGAPTFCDATESKQRTQPRGLRPLGHSPPAGTVRTWPSPLTGRRQRKLCKEKPSPRVPSGTATVGRTPRSHPRRRAQPRLARFCPRWLRDAILPRPQSVLQYRAPPGMAGAHATRRVAGIQLADQLRTAGRICITLFGLAPTHQGASRLGAEAGDSTNRDRFSPKLRPHTFLRAMPPRRGGRPTPPPGGRPQYAAPRDEIAPPLAPVLSHLATNRAHWARESPPPRAARGAARHSKIGACFAKPRWRRPRNKLSPNAPTPAILTMRVAASGKSYELCRVARAAGGGGDSRTPTECRFPTC